MALKKAKENKLQKVTKIIIELGQVLEHGQEIQPENLKFNIKELARGTAAESAKVQIKPAGNAAWKLVEIEGE